MATLESVREQIRAQWKREPRVHMDVSLVKEKLYLDNAEATITGVYPHLFQIEENSSGKPKRHTIQYGDVLVGHIVIREMSGSKA